MVLDIAGSHNGLVKEKYDVVSRSAEVAVEYGNQGADRGPLLAPRSERTLGFAWTNASVLLLLDGLSPALREALDAGIPADRVLGPPRDQGGRGRSRKKARAA
jgi:alpha,alpha-trehalase